MNTVDWSPDGLQLASGDDKGIIQVLANLFLHTRTLISIVSMCGFSLRFFWGCSWHVHDEFIMILADLGSRFRPNHANSGGSRRTRDFRYF